MAIRAFGTKFYLDGDLFGGIDNFDPIAPEATIVEVTTHESTGNSREFIGGLVDGAELAMSGFYVFGDTGQDAIRAGLATEYPCYIMFSDNSGFSFAAIVKSTGENNPEDDAVEFSASAKITGAVNPVYPTMTITGTLTDGTDSVVFPELNFVGMDEGKPLYRKIVSTVVTHEAAWTGTEWLLQEVGGAVWASTADVATPDLVPTGDWHTTTNPTAWKPTSPATGTPIVTGS